MALAPWPEPLPDAPITRTSLAELHLADCTARLTDSTHLLIPYLNLHPVVRELATERRRWLADLDAAGRAAELIDGVRSFVPMPRNRYDGTWFGDAVRILADAEDVVAAVVAAERERRVSWDNLAAAATLPKSSVHHRWSPAWRHWEVRLAEAERDGRHVLGQDPARYEEYLAKWIERNQIGAAGAGVTPTCISSAGANPSAFEPRRHAGRETTLFGDAMAMLGRAEELVAAVVVAERAHGTSWADLAEAAELSVSSVYERWSKAEDAWEARLAEAERDGHQPLGQDPVELAERLDEWVQRNAQPADLKRGEKPVTALVRRMDPLAELSQLMRAGRRLWDAHMTPPPALLAPITERRAVVEEAMAEWSAQHQPAAAGHYRDAAAKNRAWAAELRRQAAEGDTGKPWLIDQEGHTA